jgi:hypothetical protein
MYRSSTLCLLALVSAAAQSASLRLSHPYGELIDRDPATVHFEASYPNEVDCRFAPVVTKGPGNAIGVDVRLRTPGSGPICTVPNQTVVGELAAGWWTVTLRFQDPDALVVVEQVSGDWLVSPPGTLCGRHPELRGSVIATHRSLRASQVAARVATDAAFAAALRNPIEIRPGLFDDWATYVYDWIDNEHDLAAALRATDEFASVSPNGLACFSAPPPDQHGNVIEFFNASLGHYFYTVDPNEIAALDSGSGAQGWARTGNSFRVLVQPGCPTGRRDQGAYRFFGKPGVGPSSHVFTVDRRECRVVADSGAWLYENSPFWASPTDSRGGCLAGGVPLYRAWKPFGESNHRFTTDRDVIAEMVAKGWVDEGIAMCVSS